jgi:hypothetical protein
MAEPYKYSPWLRPRNEGPPAAASEAAMVQPFKCSQQVKLGFRFASAPLRFHYPLPGFPESQPQTKTPNPKSKNRRLRRSEYGLALN